MRIRDYIFSFMMRGIGIASGGDKSAPTARQGGFVCRSDDEV